MSHTATVDVEIRDITAFEEACRRLGVEGKREEEVRLFDGTIVKGISVRLKGWHYPVVFKDGKAIYDNFNGLWGKEEELNKFRQTYAACAAKRQAQRQGFRVREQRLADGRIQLICSK